MHSVHGRRLGVIPSKRAFSERFESSREVVVHGDGRGTRDLGNGSRTCPERNLSHPRYSGIVEVVVRAPVDELDGSHEKSYSANPRSCTYLCAVAELDENPR